MYRFRRSTRSPKFGGIKLIPRVNRALLRVFFVANFQQHARLEVSPNLRHAGVFQTSTMANLGIGFQEPLTRVSMGWWLLRLSAKILALLRLLVNFFQLRLIVNFTKTIFVKKQKQKRERPEICRGLTFIVKEMAVFTLEKY